ncbi:hypothetical protein AVEN_255503-1 [Araneus ventricosus]|uniref:Uncharacterized protein n=1 Tax=Araneus ventricosus TaxID=182803 RepID=A0A4Y2VWF5_ARAVE|nr:hypothetical protein AVEN_255503-1 [Araneus ventricosus]
MVAWRRSGARRRRHVHWHDSQNILSSLKTPVLPARVIDRGSDIYYRLPDNIARASLIAVRCSPSVLFCSVTALLVRLKLVAPTFFSLFQRLYAICPFSSVSIECVLIVVPL